MHLINHILDVMESLDRVHYKELIPYPHQLALFSSWTNNFLKTLDSSTSKIECFLTLPGFLQAVVKSDPVGFSLTANQPA